MGFEKYILCQLEAHPAMTAQDVVKLCYQGAYGPGHLLKDIRKAKEYFDEEFANVDPSTIPLVESISDLYCRINLSAWKNTAMPSQWLFDMFLMSADSAAKDEKVLLNNLKTAENFISDRECLEKYRASGMPAVHHSDAYREAERPSYRVVNRRIVRILPVLKKVSEILEDKPTVVIAIDGRAASGKSTMAEHLKTILGGEVIRMDDFFLPGELRTDERFAVPGSNVHYERFMDEVLPAVGQPQSFVYRKFDCGVMDYVGNVEITNACFRIVEGSYSCHPEFGNYPDVRVFSDVESDIQMQRIIHRNGSEMAEIFKSRWIPMEEAYFKAYGILDKADIIV